MEEIKGIENEVNRMPGGMKFRDNFEGEKDGKMKKVKYHADQHWENGLFKLSLHRQRKIIKEFILFTGKRN